MTEIKQKIEYVEVSRLKNHPDNPRKVDEWQMEKLCESIQKNPDYFETRPILCNTDMVVFAGNMRLLAAKKLGLSTVPVSIMDITVERQREIMIRDNRQNGQWDFDMLANNFDVQELVEWGFEEKELLGSAFNPPEPKDDDVPSIPVEPKSKLGDLYILGEHRVLCGDSTKRQDLQKLMDGRTADMVFTDPPYNVNYSGTGENTDNGIMNDNMSDDEFDSFLVDSFNMMREFTKPDAGCYVFHSHKTSHQFETALNKSGFTIDTQLIWNKPSAGMGMNDYRTKHEPFFYCSQEKKKQFYGDRTGTTVWKIPEDPEKAFKWFLKTQEALESGDSTVFTVSRSNTKEYSHPTQKPVELPSIAISKSSRHGEIVLDQFLGSGTTLIASEKTGRICYGMELDPKYVDVIVERWEKFTGKKAEKIEYN